MFQSSTNYVFLFMFFYLLGFLNMSGFIILEGNYYFFCLKIIFLCFK